MMSLLSLLTERASRTADLPVLEGFLKSASLRLPPGTLIAEEGVCVTRDAAAGAYAVAVCQEAWVALRLDQGAGWYALWCPYAARWEVLSFELEPGAEAGRGTRQGRRQRQAGH